MTELKKLREKLADREIEVENQGRALMNLKAKLDQMMKDMDEAAIRQEYLERLRIANISLAASELRLREALRLCPCPGDPCICTQRENALLTAPSELAVAMGGLIEACDRFDTDDCLGWQDEAGSALRRLNVLLGKKLPPKRGGGVKINEI